MTKRTMEQAIKSYCLECSNHSKKEVELCPMKKCPLYSYRLGTDQDDHFDHDEKNIVEIKSFYQRNLFE
jgi:hypothetical protein